MTLGDSVPGFGLSHAALLYDSDDQLLDIAVPFLVEGVAGGAPTLLSVSERQQPLILDALGDTAGVTVVARWASGTACRALRQNHQLINAGAEHGAGQIHILGEVPSPSEAVPWGGWVRYETAINHVYSELPVSVLCPYDRRTTPRSVLDDVTHTHPKLMAMNHELVSNAAFVEPTTFLGDLADRDLDPIESESPALELVDQLP